MMLRLMEVLNYSWLRNFHAQLRFSNSRMQRISWINERDIPSFRKQYGLAIYRAHDYGQSIRSDSREERTNVFLSNCDRQRTTGSATPFVGVAPFV
jgi:hypothetical protein